MQSPTASSHAPGEIVIPDCCNIGVIFRSLLTVNVAALCVNLLHAATWKAGLSAFVEAAILIELTSLSSLLALCGLRRIVRAVPLWGQRAVCAMVPAVVTGLIVRFLMANDKFADGFANLSAADSMLIAALFGIVLQHYFEMRTRAFSPALVEARLQALQARIRPHFLFNSLNAVLSLIRTEPLRAESTLEDLADLFRVLMRDTRDNTTLEDEIRLCKKYLSIEKIRLAPRLQVQWKAINVTDRVLRRAQVPSLLLQPLLENAVHYGVEPAREPVQIRIELTRAMDRIEIVVTNPIPQSDRADGKGNPGNHMALANIRERLALLYDVEAQLTTTVVDGVFVVRLRFPYVKAN
jgi:two-component system sensor histidine kinase AlgZ